MLAVSLSSGCSQRKNYAEEKITTEAFSDMKAPAFVYDLPAIRKQLADMARQDHGKTDADQHTRSYYLDAQHLLWVDKAGVGSRADSLLSWLHQVGTIGMTERSFGVKTIEQDLQRLRSLAFDEQKNSINHVIARLEYALTKACMRYTYGHRFGFVNPHRAFNYLLPQKQDSTGRVLRYYGLFDVDMDLPDTLFAHALFSKIANDSIASYLHAIQPKGAYYRQLLQMLDSTTDDSRRQLILCNLERSRWHLKHPIPDTGKRIVVNIPAFHLYAYNADSVLDMKVVCGATTTRTPQLSSEIERMEVNPQWVIPMSIISNDVAHHAGDASYFGRHRYKIYDRATNKQLSVGEVSRQMMLSGKYRVAQDGGAGNSLGRIVFRFNNKFSVFLHDTSNPGAFAREVRSLSHGCVRVSKPFELARFVLDSPDEWLLDKIHISMGLGATTSRGREYLASHPDDTKLVSHLQVSPRVPLYIIYNTLWPDQNGVIRAWNDIYGYDRVIWERLKTYMQ